VSRQEPSQRIAIPMALTIGGSDPTGGAGIQADLATFRSLGVHGLTVVTSVTAQNTSGVQGIEHIAPAMVELQLRGLLADLPVTVMKTGMLATGATVEVVARELEQCSGYLLVVDPVITASGGQRLLDTDGVAALTNILLPLASIITPNLDEAAVLTGEPVTDLQGMRRAAEQIRNRGADWVLVKGGHLPGDPIDILYDGKQHRELRGERMGSAAPHGTGCALSAAICAYLAQGRVVEEAVMMAREYVQRAIASSFRPGRGAPLLRFEC
jgi:hydroxymethylpyrimidine/phosphomethylpyrimidine kinase